MNLIILGGVFVSTGHVEAAIDNTVNFQGKIVNSSNGTNVTSGNPGCIVSGPSNDTCDFRIRIFNASTAGDWMFGQTFQDVEIENFNGIFNLVINGCNSLPDGTSQWGTTPSTCSISGLTTSSITTVQDDTGDSDSDPGVNFNRNDLWMELSFAPSNTSGSLGSFTETFSRKKLQSVPSAFTAQTLGGISKEGFVQIQPITAQTISGVGSTTIVNINETGAGTPDFLDFAVGGGSVFNIRNNGTLGIATSTSTAYLNIAAATAAKPQIKLISSGAVNPTTPTSGDLWWNGTNLNFRTGSSTVDLLSGGPSSDLVCTACVSNTELKTATGAASGSLGAGGVHNITINNYSFFPNVYTTSTSGPSPWPSLGLFTNGIFDTIGRFSIREDSNCCGNGFTYVASWRYVTASREPEIFAYYDILNKEIVNIFRSEVETTKELPLDVSQSGIDLTNLVPIQATIHSADLYKLNIQELTKNYIFTEYYKSTDIDRNHPILKETLDSRDSCLIAKNNDTTKCFRLIETPEIYYGKLEKCIDCGKKISEEILENEIIEEQSLQVIQSFDNQDLSLQQGLVGNELENLADLNSQDYLSNINSAYTVAVNQNGIFELAQKSASQNYIGVSQDVNNTNQSISITGKSKVFISSTTQQISPGDYITLSDEPGKVERLTGGGFAIGKAISFQNNGLIDAMLFTVIVPGDSTQIPVSSPTEQQKEIVFPTTFEAPIEFKDDVSISGQLYLSNKSTGTIIIPAGENIGYVNFTEPFTGIPNISLTPNGKEFIDNEIYYSVISKDQNGFKIMVNHPISSDLRFDWLAIGVK